MCCNGNGILGGSDNNGGRRNRCCRCRCVCCCRCGNGNGCGNGNDNDNDDNCGRDRDKCRCSNQRAYRAGFDDGYQVGYREGCNDCGGNLIQPRGFSGGCNE